MGQFDQFANQGGPAAESADALAEARRKADEQLRTADYSGDLPEPLSGGRHAADAVTAAGEDERTGSGSDAVVSDPVGSDLVGSDAGGSSSDSASADASKDATSPAAASDGTASSSDGGDGRD